MYEQAWPSIASLRNPGIHACSYIYEFSWSPCTWANNNAPKLYLTEDRPGHLWPDANNDKVISWREIKASEQKGTRSLRRSGRMIGRRIATASLIGPSFACRGSP